MVLCSLKYVKIVNLKLMLLPHTKKTERRPCWEAMNMFSALTVLKESRCMRMSKLINVYTLNVCNFY